jgi:hypothetical protein
MPTEQTGIRRGSDYEGPAQLNGEETIEENTADAMRTQAASGVSSG